MAIERTPVVARVAAVVWAGVRETLYGAIFVKGVPQGSYPFSDTSVSLFDLSARFFIPTHTDRGGRRAQERSRMAR
jgi:hypothetical protein